MLAEHLIETFPQLEGIRFTHRWGGAIDTCSRFFAFYGTALGGHVSYAVAIPASVSAPRFGAEVALDPSTGSTRRSFGCRSCAPCRACSRPSRCARRESR